MEPKIVENLLNSEAIFNYYRNSRCGASKKKPFCDGTQATINARPWIDADGANSEDIINTIRKCPAGALSYSIDGVEYRDPNERTPIVTVSKDGPYIIT